MQIKPIPEELKNKLAIVSENLANSKRESDEASLIASARRKEVAKLHEELTLLKRDISINVGGNTNWEVDDSGEHVVLVERANTNPYPNYRY